MPSIIAAVPDQPLYQSLVCNMSVCLSRMGRADEAIDILESIAKAQRKPCEYFVNLSFALLRVKRFEEAEAIAKEGLSSYPDDLDLLGNVTTSLIGCQ